MIERRSVRGPTVLAGVGLALLLLTIPQPVSAATLTEPIVLQDPGTGDPAQLGPGARALHVVFFATWCPACNEELDRLSLLEARWSGRGYRLVMVAVTTRQSIDRLRRFLGDQLTPGTLLFDADGRAEASLAPDGLPTHILFDGSGREVSRSAALDAEFEAAVEALVTAPERLSEPPR